MRSTTSADDPSRDPLTAAAGSPPSVVSVRRERLDSHEEPAQVLRRFRGRDRLVALVGAWHHGEALVACDPAHVLGPDDDPFDLPLPVVEQDGTGAGFGCGWIGVWGHRLGGRVERVQEPRERPVPQPDARLAFYAWVLRRVRGTWWLEWLDGTDVSSVREVLAGAPGEPRPHAVGTFALVPSPEEHARGVARAVEHVHAGDLFQVNLCARLESSFEGDPLDLFCAGLETLRPAYGAYVGPAVGHPGGGAGPGAADWPGGGAGPGAADWHGAVASFSPELFLRRVGHEVLTSPIKGTAPVTGDDDTDPSRLALLASAKDRAENVMIVDLMRNDLGRVCSPGSVRVPALVRAERHAVWQLVSDVVGHLAPGVDDAALLRATFPPGSVTGAPKVRAMEVAAELEPTGREAYTGAIGHVSPLAGLEANVVIRTVEIADGRAWIGVGGGVVADSQPAAELAEVFVKARPVVAAIGGTLLDDVPPVVRSAPGERHRATAPVADARRGVFTTLLVRDGTALDVDAHVARLDASVRAVYGSTVTAGLESAVARHARGLPEGEHRLRVEAVPVDPLRVGEEPVAVRVALTSAPLQPVPPAWRLEVRVVAGGWGSDKWVDRAVLDPAEGFDDLLLVDVDGSVLEGGRTNVFVVLDDGVHTPPLDGRILPGTGRARVVDALLAEGLPLHQRRLTLADVAAASEVFVTNALRGVVPVREVEGVATWSAAAPGPVVRSLRTSSRTTASATTAGSSVGGAAASSVGRPRPRRSGARVLFVDNYDSFVFNLVQYVRELGAQADVVRNDELDLDALVAARAAGDLTHVVVSPGPGAPADAGASIEVVRRLGPTTPLLGVCLGHQAIAEAYGGRVVRAPEVVHGKASLVHHDGRGVHAGLPTPLVVARYHSLVAEESSLPPDLEVTSRTATGVVMGLRHRTHPVEGVQWHPESILTRHGHDLLATFLAGRGST